MFQTRKRAQRADSNIKRIMFFAQKKAADTLSDTLLSFDAHSKAS